MSPLIEEICLNNFIFYKNNGKLLYLFLEIFPKGSNPETLEYYGVCAQACLFPKQCSAFTFNLSFTNRGCVTKTFF